MTPEIMRTTLTRDAPGARVRGPSPRVELRRPSQVRRVAAGDPGVGNQCVTTAAWPRDQVEFTTQ